MSLPQRWALTSELTTNELSPSELAQIAAACSVQQQRDLRAAWPEANVVTVQAFPDPHAVPMGYCRAVAQGLAKMPAGALGFHYTWHRQPAIRVGFDPHDPEGLATTYSHELNEAAVDASGNRLIVCTVPGVGRREVLVEVSDAPEAFTYLVDGLPMSDFVLREWYGPHRWHMPGQSATQPGGTGYPITRPFSFTGQLDAPLVVALGGYYSFVDPDTREWAQMTWWDGPEPTIRQLGKRDEEDRRSHREWIDSRTAALSRPHVGKVSV